MKKQKKRYKWLSQCEAVCQFSNICIGKKICKPNMKYERVEITEELNKGRLKNELYAKS